MMEVPWTLLLTSKANEPGELITTHDANIDNGPIYQIANNLALHSSQIACKSNYLVKVRAELQILEVRVSP
jgi:hypothetical protein